MTTLTGKVALITGPKGGLGSAVTHAFLAAGATVAGVSRAITNHDFSHPKFRAIQGELSSSEESRKAVETALTQEGRIDILVHLVGAFAGGDPVVGTEDAILDNMIDVNLRSTFYVAKAVLPHMRSRKSGRIVAVGSRAAVEASPGAAAYSASKAAVVALIRAIAAENAADGISANVVLPGTMDTPANRKAMPQADVTKWVKTEQVAQLILTLASDDLTQINGAAIPIYGCEL
ncbi:MAG TPA: SDR family NAD(P)-dependent oxidoreductase [Bryobacteraceae bacterium]|nr:SDR family NAD(P)-dependent oxidoreductase [Bryobacteraceae bacterium]